jgi:molybdenum cofactor cytidylyltransferase
VEREINIAGVVLAAGLSRRMGRAKLLLPLEGRPVIRITVESVLAAGVAPVVVVTGTQHRELAEALAGLPVTLVNNPAPEAGQAGSIRIGIRALPHDTEAVCIALGDQPFVPSRVMTALLAALRTTSKAVVAPRYRDGRGNPVLFRRETFAELLEVSGDQGARSVIERDPSRVALVEFDDPMPQDVDTPEDYRRLRSPDNPV